MKSKQTLSSAHLSFQCPMRLEDFSNVGVAYYCGKCEREILDLTDCTIEDAIKLQRKKGQVCGLVYAVGAATVLGASSCSTIQEEAIKDQPKHGEMGSDSIPVPGMLCPPEQLKRMQNEEAGAKRD